MDVTKPYKFIWFGDIHGPQALYIRRVSMGVYFADTGSAPSQGKTKVFPGALGASEKCGGEAGSESGLVGGLVLELAVLG